MLLPKRGVIPKAIAEKLIRINGVERVSYGAILGICDILEEYASILVPKAKMFMTHAGRVTLKKSDLKVAKEALEGKYNE